MRTKGQQSIKRTGAASPAKRGDNHDRPDPHRLASLESDIAAGYSRRNGIGCDASSGALRARGVLTRTNFCLRSCAGRVQHPSRCKIEVSVQFLMGNRASVPRTRRSLHKTRNTCRRHPPGMCGGLFSWCFQAQLACSACAIASAVASNASRIDACRFL